MQRFSFALAAVAAIALANSAQAAFITTNGDVEVESTVSGTPDSAPADDVKNFSGASSDSRVYTNQFDGGPGSGNLRTIVIQRISSATDGVTYSNLEDPATGDSLYAITALEGTLTGTTVTFTSGRISIVTGVDGLDPRNPRNFTLANRIAAYGLSPQTDVLPGPNGSPITPTPAAVVNTSTLLVPPSVAQFNLLFGENLEGPNFINNVDHPLGGPSPVGGEGLFIEGMQSAGEQGAAGAANLTDDAGDLVALNAFAADAGFSDLGGANTAFATGLSSGGSSPTTDFGDGPAALATPGGTITVPIDFAGTINAQAHIVATPEPSSFALLGLGACAFGFVRRRRQKTSEMAA